ncbi:MAG: hypothetical protein GY805_09725, partial [Chloroflexi bacterium]|nr:hypothetical protein [Chloroflexota bacterium]
MRMKFPGFWQRPFPSLHSPWFAAFLFLSALFTRLLSLGRYITPDELNWVHRSVLFHQALRGGQWVNTLTTGHPGVITTWLGALGIQIQLWLRPFDLAAYEWITHLAWLAPENTAAFPQLATFLPTGRIVVAMMNSLGLVVIFRLTQRLTNHAIAVVFVLLLAIDPFIAGLSGLLHVDGLMTTFVTISLLALAVSMSEDSWRLTAVSGIVAGCAILTKSAALTLLPFAALSFLLILLIKRPFRWQTTKQGLIWLAALIVAQFLLLPAIWNDPVAVYQTIIGTIVHETEEVLPITFFWGAMKQAHGAKFYPMALLYRLNPVIFVGLLLGVWCGFKGKWSADWWQRPLTWLAISWPIYFIIVLSLATKKYDRYLLPALPMLFLLGVMGWGRLLKSRPLWTKYVILGSALVGSIYLATAVPYLLNAYNPVVATLLPAEKVMPLGWGEAVSASAKWLAQQPDAAEKTAVAGIGPAFAPFFPGKTILSGDENWGQADYVVKTAASSQASPLEPQNLQEGKTLLHTIRYDGMEQAWIFANDNPVKPEIVWNERPVIFDNQIRLLATHAVVQDDRLDVFVKWQLVQSVNGRFNIQIRLLDVAGQPWSQVEMPLLNETYFYPQNWQADEQPVWRYPLSLPP